MNVNIQLDPKRLGFEAGKKAAALIKEAIKKNGSANIILATGSSQFETLNQLIQEKGIEWNKVSMFHLDEYIGLPLSHKASFRKYLKERFLDKVPKLKSVNLI
ncbi:MAG TPA: 6-phosphogluconolactonase, partial [Hanamia sp.]